MGIVSLRAHRSMRTRVSSTVCCARDVIDSRNMHMRPHIAHTAHTTHYAPSLAHSHSPRVPTGRLHGRVPSSAVSLAPYSPVSRTL